MRNPKAFVTILILAGLVAGAAGAAEKAPASQSSAAAQEVAAFSVPQLDKGEVVKALAKALADEPGVVRAKADKKKQTFNVTFDKRTTGPDRILVAVRTVSKEAKLVAVTPAGAKPKDAGDCGNCPRAKSCPSAKK
jgi:copper chaperone CopZ